MSQPNQTWRSIVEPLSFELVSYPSITDSEGERQFASELLTVLRRIPYFEKNPDHLWFEPIADDPFNRRNVFALVKGAGVRTVLLTGHYDTVSTSNYGDLEAYALEPGILTQKLIEELSTSNASVNQQLALDDLKSGEFIPGRGLLDMKSGLAVGIAMLKTFAEKEAAPGNLLFIASPDEERFSYGMRDASQRLPAIAQKHQLNYQACINLDSSSDQGNGSQGQSIYLGSVGKPLTSVFISGQDTHAGEPLAGINPHFLASFVTQTIESNPELSDVFQGEYAPPPTLLKQTDLKEHYDVTTPATVWAMYNVLTHGKKAEQVLEDFKNLTQVALDKALYELNTRAKIFAEQRELPVKHLARQARVMHFAELKEYVFAYSSAEFRTTFKAYQQSLIDANLDAPMQNQKLTDYLWQASGLIGPAAIIGFASLHYPCVSTEQSSYPQLVDKLRNVAEGVSKSHNTSICLKPFFSGISDMSWLGKHDEKDLATVNQNTPSEQMNLSANTLNIPTLNIGPWGRDYHKKLERIHAPYSFEILPELVWQCCQEIIKH